MSSKDVEEITKSNTDDQELSGLRSTQYFKKSG